LDHGRHIAGVQGATTQSSCALRIEHSPGRMRWCSIGSELGLTPDQARAEAERLRGLKRQGFDPAADRDKRKSSPTMEKAVARFTAEHVRPKLRPRTVVHCEEILDGLIVPRFGKWRVNSITGSDVSEWHVSLAKKPTRANRSLGILSSLMSWAVSNKMRPNNPCGAVARYREQPVNRYPTATDLSLGWMCTPRKTPSPARQRKRDGGAVR
jgi:hypothetical protein